MTYAEKLKDPRWQKKRLEIMKRDEWTCQRCGDSESTLNVDHMVYHRNFDPWDYEDDDLQTVCEQCHKLLTQRRARIAERVGRMEESELYLTEHFLEIVKDNRITVVGFRLGKPALSVKPDFFLEMVYRQAYAEDEEAAYDLLDEIGGGFGDEGDG